MATARILIADDEPDLELLIRQRFRKQIREQKYSFIFARGGAEALERVRQDPEIELVLTDINMPGMDGLTLLGRLLELNPLLHSVVVSAYGDMTNIRTAMNRGAFDFLTKPIDFNDFEATLEKSLQQARTIRQAAQARDQLARVQRELDLAAHIQQSMWPRDFPHEFSGKGVEVYGAMVPARNVGGDFYDYFSLGAEVAEPLAHEATRTEVGHDGQARADRLGFVIGDVSGKGVPAALFMVMCLTLLRAEALRHLCPGECLAEVNRLLCRSQQSDLFATLFYGILDPGTGELTYSNGGHHLPYLLHPGNPTDLEVLPPETQGGVIGFREGMKYDTVRTRIRPGQSLYLYTDGVTEAMNRDRDLFGTERLEAFLARQVGSAPA